MPSRKRVRRELLPNGLTLVTERLSHSPSVTAGVWIKAGSRHEPRASSGVSHFIEHLLFKGTPSRTYSEIYKAYDRMGGQLDAFTSREIIGFYFRVQKTHFREAFDVLGDMLVHPLFPEEEMERERGVILEEIRMVGDSPADRMADLFMARAFPSHPIGRPVQGTEKSVAALTRRKVLSHHRRIVQPQNMIITATGDIVLQELADVCGPLLGALPPGKPLVQRMPSFRPGSETFVRPHLEQTQIALGFAAEPADGPNRFALLVLANLLGGTMSSRLFTELREKHGLVYSVSAEHAGFSDGGIIGINAACAHRQAERTIREIFRVLRGVLEGGIRREELSIAKENLLGGLILSMESPSARMGRLARNEVFFGRQLSIASSLKGIRSVGRGAVVEAARTFLRRDRLLAATLGTGGVLDGLDPDAF